MYEIAYETKELGFWKILATWSQIFESYVDQEGFFWMWRTLFGLKKCSAL